MGLWLTLGGRQAEQHMQVSERQRSAEETRHQDTGGHTDFFRPDSFLCIKSLCEDRNVNVKLLCLHSSAHQQQL